MLIWLSKIAPLFVLVSFSLIWPACESSPECKGPSSCPGGSKCIKGLCLVPGWDQDHDGIEDWQDKCPELAPDPNWPISDQTDSDGDSVGDLCDNCPNVKNPAQQDADGDGTGDKCQGQVIYEPEPFNDKPTTAHLLFPGVTVQATVGSPSPGPEPQADQDIWLINAQEGQILTLDAKMWPDTSTADPMLLLLDESTGGARLMRLEDDFMGSPNAHLEVLIPQTGMYRVQVIDFVNYFYPDAPVGGNRYGYRLSASKIMPRATSLEAKDQKLELELEPGKIALFHLEPQCSGMLVAHLESDGITQAIVSITDSDSGKILGQNSQRKDCAGSTQSKIRMCLSEKPVNFAIETIRAAGAPTLLSFELDMAGTTATSSKNRSILSGRQAVVFTLSPPSHSMQEVRVESTTANPALEVLSCMQNGNPPSTVAVCKTGPDFQCVTQILWQQPPQRLYAHVSRRDDEDGLCVPTLPYLMDVTLDTWQEDLEPEQLPQQMPASWIWVPAEHGSVGTWLIPGQTKIIHVEIEPVPGSMARPFATIRSEDLSIVSRAIPDSNGVTKLSWAPVDDSPLLLTVNDINGGWGEDYQVEIHLVGQRLPANLVQESTDASDTMDDAMALPGGDLLIKASLGPKVSDKADNFILMVPPGELLTVRSWAGQPGIVPDTSVVLMDHHGLVLARGDGTGRDQLGSIQDFAGRDTSPVFLRVTFNDDASSEYRLEIRRAQAPSDLLVRPVGKDLSVNEIQLHPEQDFNADGKINYGDQFLELLNTSPYTLRLDRVLIKAAGAQALFGDLQISSGQAILLFNGQPPSSDIYPVEVFGLGNSDQWLATGQNALQILRTDEDATGLDFQTTFVPAVEPGHSANRIVDGDPDRIMRDHLNVAGSVSESSPGTRADGKLWGVD